MLAIAHLLSQEAATMHEWLPDLPRQEDGRARRTPATEAAHARYRRGPSKWRLRLGLGPSRRDLHAAAVVMQYRTARAEAEMREAHARAKAAEKECRAQRQAVTEAVAAAYEPATNGECTKTRLHTMEEARAFAARVAAGLGCAPDEFTVYRCKSCPRHPATGQRFLHIANNDPALRGEAGKDAKGKRSLQAAQQRRRAGNVRVADSLNPADVAQLRARFGTQEEKQ